MTKKEIRGIPGSPGRIGGIAYVTESLEHAKNIKRSEILVTRAITAEWLDVVVHCRALVTDVGGKTSHGASMPREIGIPAVVGTMNATKHIKSGFRLIVNGTQGTVSILK